MRARMTSEFSPMPAVKTKASSPGGCQCFTADNCRPGASALGYPNARGWSGFHALTNGPAPG
jgi:hypothetical protein